MTSSDYEPRTLAERLPSDPFETTVEGEDLNENELIIAAVTEAMWKVLRDDVELLLDNQHPATMNLESLERFARPWFGITKKSSETVEEYRIRVISKLRQLYGGVTEDNLIELMENFMGIDAGPGDITITDNINASGEFVPFFIRVDFDLSLLDSKFDPDEQADAVVTIREQLEENTAAGVQVQLQVTGGATWDDGDTWDTEGVVWGS